MRILVVTQYYYPEPFRIHEICKGLISRGNTVSVMTTFPNYPEGEIYADYKDKRKKYECIDGVEVYRIKSIPRGKTKIRLSLNYLSFWFEGKKKIITLFKKKRFDIVYSYEVSPIMQVFPAIKYSQQYNIPLMLYCLDIWPECFRDSFPNERTILYKYIKHISKKIYNSATKIGVTSKSFIQYLHKECSVPYEKLLYLPQHADDVALNEDLTTVENECVDIVFTGNVGESQNMDQIVDAVKLLSDVENFKVHIVGAGSALQHTQERVNKEGLADKIIFYGKRPYKEMPKFYRLADACLLTLSNKTQTGVTIPGKLQGYMAAGKPIIASINGDAADVIKEANCGICVPADDAELLAKAMREFVCNKEKYQECGINARKYYEKYFTLKTHIDALNEQLKVMVRENENLDN